MLFDRTRQPLSRVAKIALSLELILSAGAVAGGLILILAPRGEIIPLPLSALAGSPFDTYFVPGLILFVVLGLGPLVAARLAWRRHPLAPAAAFVVGTALLIWVGAEVAIIGYSNEPPLQAIYLVVGVAILLGAIRWLWDVGLPSCTPRRPGMPSDARETDRAGWKRMVRASGSERATRAFWLRESRHQIGNLRPRRKCRVRVRRP
jgi:hypothetical protein